MRWKRSGTQWFGQLWQSYFLSRRFKKRTHGFPMRPRHRLDSKTTLLLLVDYAPKMRL
jgi:hypothetical protein